MGNKILIIVGKDVKLLMREHTMLLLITVFIVMTLASTIIGWSAQHTIRQAYACSVNELAKSGCEAPPLPISDNPLSLMKNMIIYIPIIAALLAIVIGHILAVNDRIAGTTRMLFAKPFSKSDFFWGKVGAAGLLLGILLISSAFVSTISIYCVSGIHVAQCSTVALFYLVSFIYLSGFAFSAMFFGMISRNTTEALLMPLLLWLAITFVLPELGSALQPTNSMNPVLPTTEILKSPALKVIHSCVYPFSVSEHFKYLSGEILNFSPKISVEGAASSYPWIVNLLILTTWMTATGFAGYFAIRRYNPALGDDYE